MVENELVAFERFFFVGSGAVPGALIRWLLNNDLAVNLLGTLVFGIVMGLRVRFRFQLIFCIGFCGACTTFSGWVMETVELVNDGMWLQGISLIMITIIFGIIALFAGFFIGRRIKESISP